MKGARGFTLIELIVVIVILGILAATALPKFMDMGGDARKAVVNSLEGSMRSASTMVYAKAALAGKVSDTTSTLSSTEIPGLSGTLALSYGYPKTVSDLVKVMDIDTSSTNAKYALDTTGTPNGISVKNYTVANCGVGYTAAGAQGASPTFALNVGSC